MIPALNEERHLAQVVAAALEQDYPGIEKIVLSVGPSSDSTWDVAQALAQQHPQVIVVANDSGRTPDALNRALQEISSDIVVRCDAHALLPPDYVRIAVDTLSETGADNVGGIMDAQGETTFQRAVAWAMKSRFGVGASAFHVGGKPGPAETVYLGCFRKSALDRVQGYDPGMTRAQDWEMNFRIRATGGSVWFNPALKVTYRPRRTLRSLATQYKQYGEWRRKVMRMHPATTRSLSALRYLAPPVALLLNSVGFVVGLWAAVTNSPLVWSLVIPGTYVLAVMGVSASALATEQLRVVMRLPLVIATMHHSWGWGFLTSRR
jgi:glycosyltransferase involved in cell wall biosynthesis